MDLLVKVSVHKPPHSELLLEETRRILDEHATKLSVAVRVSGAEQQASKSLRIMYSLVSCIPNMFQPSGDPST